jgi:hypothetical protein
MHAGKTIVTGHRDGSMRHFSVERCEVFHQVEGGTGPHAGASITHLAMVEAEEGAVESSVLKVRERKGSTAAARPFRMQPRDHVPYPFVLLLILTHPHSPAPTPLSLSLSTPVLPSHTPQHLKYRHTRLFSRPPAASDSAPKPPTPAELDLSRPALPVPWPEPPQVGEDERRDEPLSQLRRQQATFSPSHCAYPPHPHLLTYTPSPRPYTS